jgi:hypothetical protein
MLGFQKGDKDEKKYIKHIIWNTAHNSYNTLHRHDWRR